MKKTPLEKFQELWGSLKTEEKTELFDILAALRGPDFGGWGWAEIKMLTTARIRAVVFKGEPTEEGFSRRRSKFNGMLVNEGKLNKDYQKRVYKFLREEKNMKNLHFVDHLRRAVCALKNSKGGSLIPDLRDALAGKP